MPTIVCRKIVYTVLLSTAVNLKKRHLRHSLAKFQIGVSYIES